MRIVVTQDIFRGRESGLTSVGGNARWLNELLRVALIGTNSDLRLVQPVSEGGNVDVARVYERLGIPASAAGWAQMVSEPMLAGLPELTPLMSTDLVVGFGLTPALMRGLDAAGVRILDIEISPLRFGRNLFFRARTTCATTRELLQLLQVSRDEIAQDVQFVAGKLALFAPRDKANGAFGVAFGQSHIDLSIVERGRIASLEDDGVIQRLTALAETVEELHVVPHPSLSARPSNLHRVLDEIPNAVLERQQAYSYLAAEDLRFVTALSSSTLREAEAFGRTARPLITPDRDCAALLPPGLSEWFDVHDVLFSPATWRYLTEVPGAADLPGFHPRHSSIIRRSLRWPAPDVQPLRPLPRLDSGRVHSLSSGSRATQILRSGWSDPESWGTWSCSSYASLAFRFDTADPVRVRIDLQLFAPEPLLAPEIRVRAPGAARFMRADLKQSGQDLYIEFDVDPASTRGLCNIAFQALSPSSPASLGISADDRPLSVGLKSIEIQTGGATHDVLAARQASAFRSGNYEDLHAGSPGYQRNNWLLPYVRLLGHLTPRVVVECGCGNGAFVEAIAAFSSEVIGLDWAASPLFPHSRRGVRFQQWDAILDAVPDADLVCSADFLEHMPPENVQDVLGRILTAAPAQFHVVACYDDLHSHLTIEPPASWLARFNRVLPSFRLIDGPTRSQDRTVAILTNIPAERLVMR